MNPMPSLSFCITCKNRLHQIRQTLRKNLDDNELHQDFIEFVLVDFDSNDGLCEWIVENFRSELSSGYLKYYYTNKLSLWHASIAKNTAHFCAIGDILVNLDCDNFTGTWGGIYILNAFARNSDHCIVHQFSGNIGDGSYGRIAMKRRYFDRIGGYDESFEPMGYQDHDLIERLLKIGLKYVLCSDPLYNQAIFNTKEESIAHTGSPKNYTQMLETNYNQSILNIAEGYIIANKGKFGVRESLFDYKKELFHPNSSSHVRECI